MFLVINKDKIVSYIISFSTVALLFMMSFAITKKNDEILQTAGNAVAQNNTIVEENVIESSNNNQIYSNNTLKNEYNTIGEK